jgi:M6 family metalloprotease-like protein
MHSHPRPLFAALVTLTLAACGDSVLTAQTALLDKLDTASSKLTVSQGSSGDNFTQVYTGSIYKYGDLRPTSLPSVMVCMTTSGGSIPTLARLQQMMSSVQSYFTFSSQGRFSLADTVFVGCGGTTGTINAPAARPAYDVRSTHDALEAAYSQLGFNFAAYDTNNDGLLDGKEVVVTVMMSNAADPNKPKGGNLASAHRPASRTRDFALGSVNFVELIDCSFQGSDTSEVDRVAKYATMAHEIMHQAFNADDMYGVTDFGAEWDSLMDKHFDGSVLDPFHAIKLGWQNVKAYPMRDVNFQLEMLNYGAAQIAVIYDEALSGVAKEYFLVENRSDMLLVWRIVEDVDRLKASPWAAQFQGAIAAGLWGRYAIHKLQPTYISKDNGKVVPLIMTTGDTGWKVRVRQSGGGSTLVATVERTEVARPTIDFSGDRSTRRYGPISATKSFKATLTGSGGDADIKVFQDINGTLTKVCSSESGSSEEECVTTGPGLYYVDVWPYSGNPKVTLSYFR